MKSRLRSIQLLMRLPGRYLDYRRLRMRPLWSTFALTENCNARCQYCQYWRQRHSDLSTEAVFTILRRLKALGVVSVVFSGGECLLRSDLAQIVAFTGRLGMVSGVVTNGTLCDPAHFYTLMQQGLGALTFSLDGTSSQTHEAFRRGCGFRKVTDTIRTAAKIRLRHGFSTRIATTTVVHKGNLADLAEIPGLGRALGVDNHFFQPIWPIFGESAFERTFGFSHLDRPDLVLLARRLKHIPSGNLAAYFDLIPDLYRDFHRIAAVYQCFAGRAFVHVDAAGNLLPCSPMADEPLGSLLHDEGEPALTPGRIREKLKRYQHFECGGCTMACYMEKNIAFSGLANPLRLLRRMR